MNKWMWLLLIFLSLGIVAIVLWLHQEDKFMQELKNKVS